MCCAFCYFENLHPDHKLIKASDIESLSKENITLESITKDFNELSKKVIDLKNKIKSEINKINELYENTINDLTKSYIKKHELLLDEENELKENLKSKVNEIKEKLELYLSESNNNIKVNEMINEGIKNMDKEDKNMIKLLSYVSKINENKEKNIKLFSESMKNIKFKYEEDKNKINDEEYYFNGFTPPKNIKIKDVTSSSFNISWEIDNSNKTNNENIKYRIDVRKENEEFIQKYKGDNNNCTINNLILNTNYEVIIYLIYNNLIASNSEVFKIKTLDLDSNILNESKRLIEFKKKLDEWTESKSMELIFRGTRDGLSNSAFHNKCDNKGETITLIKNENGDIFGGYASISWTSGNGKYHSAPESFLFTLVNSYNTEPTKFPSKNDEKEVYHNSGNGPIFGAGYDLGVYGDIQNKGGWSYFPNTYEDVLGKGKLIFSNDSNKGSFKIKEIEVFKIVQ